MIERVFLKFGDSCNLNCSYCLQKNKNKNYAYNEYFIKQLSDDECNINARFVLLGGEPLLWKDRIKNAIEIISPKHNITIITNGKLLTEEDISYFNDMDVRVTISWDGHFSIIDRGYDVLCEENIEKLSKIKNLKFSSLITNNSFLLDKFKEFNRIDDIRSKNNLPKLLFDIKPTYGLIYTSNSLSKIRKESLMLNALSSNNELIKNYLNNIFLNVNKQRTIHKSCTTNITLVTYRTDGKRLRCPSASISDTNVYSTAPDIDEQCSSCKLYNICKLPCFYLTKDPNNFCAVQKSIYSFLL